jgi:type VI secretion system secreted protein VgrG
MATSAQLLAANKRFEFISRAFGEDKFAVVKMSGFESISKPFRFTLTLVSNDPDIDFDKVLQNPAELRIFAPGGASSTPYHGMIAAFEQLHKSDGYVFYQAVLVPRLWQLSLYQVSEVYLEDQAIPETVKNVLEQSRLSSADFEFKLSGSYRKRSYVCQYQETHLDFLSRWMEKEGMYFYFEHEGRNDKLAIVDNRSMHAATAVKVLYRPINEQDTGNAGDSVQEFVCRQEPLPKQVVLRDFNHRKAHIELKVTAPVSDGGMGEINIYGENFRDEEEGKRYAKLRAEEILCGARVFSGEATAVGLRSGYFMEMDRHYRLAFNGRYLVTEVHHEGSQAAALLTGTQGMPGAQGEGAETQGETNYRASFRAIPAATQFRPQRTTAKPKVIGTMNAIIDGAGLGEYAELDAWGQYKVQLPFDNSDKSAGKGSARVRMASPYAGSDHGMNFPLQKNAEVLLSFVDGDPDQPVILGAVPNSENPSVVNHDNPHENKITTKGGNQIFMGDAKSKQMMWLHSPTGNTSIGMGSTHDDTEKDKDKDKKAEGGLAFITGGAKQEVTIGNKYELSIGLASEIKLGGETKIEAGFANEIKVNRAFAFSHSDEVKWVKGSAYVVEEEESYKISHHDSNTSAKGINLKGGFADDHAQHLAFEALRKTATRGILAVTALNVAASAGFMAWLMKTKDGEHAPAPAPAPHATGHEPEGKDPNQVAQEKEQKLKFTGKLADWNTAAKISAGAAAVNTALTLTALTVVRKLLKGYAEEYDKLKYVGELDLSKSGVKLTAATQDSFTEMTQLDKGFSLRTLPAADVAADPPDNANKSVISAAKGITSVNAGTSIRLTSPDINIAIPNGKNGIGMDDTGVMLAANHTTLMVEPNAVSIVSQKVALGFTRAPPPLVVDPIATAALAVAVAAHQAAVTAYRVPGVKSLSNQARGVLFDNLQARKADLLVAQNRVAQLAAIPAPAGNVNNGFEVDTTKAEMVFGNAGVRANDTGLAFKFGTTSSMNFSPAGLKADGSIIQLG